MRLRSVVALVALAVVAGSGPSASGADKPLRKVVIVSAATVLDTSQANNSSVPRYMKYWEEEGLDVEVQPSTAAASVQMMITGKADMAYGGPSGVFAIRDKGAAVKAVYLNVRKNIYLPVVLDSSPIGKVADFKGKVMGVSSYGAQMNEIFKGMFEEAGLNPETDVTRVEVGMGAQAVSALTSNRIQVWGSWDSQIATAENLGLKLRKFDSPYASSLSFGAGYYVREDFLKQHPDVIAGVLRGIAKGSVFTLANPEAAVKIHWRVYPNTKPQGVDEPTAFRRDLHILTTRLGSVRLEPGVRWGQMTRESVDAYQNFLVKFKRIAKRMDPETFYTNEFIAKANAFDEQAILRQAAEFK